MGSFAGATIIRSESYGSSGAFTDPGADAWTATVNYGDGSGTQSLALSGKSFSLAHSYATAGTFTVTVTVQDDDLGTGSRTGTAVVLSAAEAIGSLSEKFAACMSHPLHGRGVRPLACLRAPHPLLRFPARRLVPARHL